MAPTNSPAFSVGKGYEILPQTKGQENISDKFKKITPPKTNDWNLKLSHLEKETHLYLYTKHQFLGSMLVFGGVGPIAKTIYPYIFDIWNLSTQIVTL